jgi:hypothetical protein
MSEFTPDNWNTYRTRFLVRAKQLTKPFSFTDPLGREHHGRPGDYLVQSSNGLLRIAPREIFEDVYVVMEGDPERQEPKSPFGNQPAEHFPADSSYRQHAHLMALVEKQADLPELIQLIQCDTIYCDYLLTRTTYSSSVAIPEAVKSVVLRVPSTPENGILGR